MTDHGYSSSESTCIWKDCQFSDLLQYNLVYLEPPRSLHSLCRFQVLIFYHYSTALKRQVTSKTNKPTNLPSKSLAEVINLCRSPAASSMAFLWSAWSWRSSQSAITACCSCWICVCVWVCVWGWRGRGDKHVSAAYGSHQCTVKWVYFERAEFSEMLLWGFRKLGFSRFLPSFDFWPFQSIFCDFWEICGVFFVYAKLRKRVIFSRIK